jgi:hypothetical protein
VCIIIGQKDLHEWAQANPGRSSNLWAEDG